MSQPRANVRSERRIDPSLRTRAVAGMALLAALAAPAHASGDPAAAVAASRMTTGTQSTACFTDIAAGLPVVNYSAVAWGDYDNDGDLDILLSGQSNTGLITRVYRNSGGPNPTFSDIGTGLPGIAFGAVAWADFNGDGWLDILMASGSFTKIYKNNGGANPLFTDWLLPLPDVGNSSVACADFDHDGDVDFAITGNASLPTFQIARIYRNNGGANPTFTDIGAGLQGTESGPALWGDYDNDGNLDLFVAGWSGAEYTNAVYHNDGGTNPTFTVITHAGVGANSASALGDYDNDGDLDLLSTGGQVNGWWVVWDNTGEEPYFEDARVIGPPDAIDGTIAWGDYNNDGWLDVLIAGYNGMSPSTKVFQNNGGAPPTFTDIGAGLVGVGEIGSGSRHQSSCAWGDYDNDGRLDLLVTGWSLTGAVALVYHNTCGSPNTLATPPSNPHMSLAGSHATFSWSPAVDVETPAAGLTYNLRVGSAPGLSDIVGPAANTTNGYRRLVAMGNTNLNTTWEVDLPGLGPYYWSVQAVDGAYAGSPFTSDRSTTTDAGPTSAPSTDALLCRGPNPTSGATAIELDLARAQRVALAVFDANGRRVRALGGEDLPAGRFTRYWDGRDDAGAVVPAGVYFVRMAFANSVRSAKVSVVR